MLAGKQQLKSQSELSDIFLIERGRAIFGQPDSDGLLVFCDCCGMRDKTLALNREGEVAWADPNTALPAGWLARGKFHLCPECRAAYDQAVARVSQVHAAKELMASYEFKPPQNPLSVEEAQSLPAENGVLTVPDGYDAITRKAFMYRTDMKRVVLPDSMRFIGDFAFSCSALESFTAPPFLEAIGKRAFYRCASLANVALNERLRKIDDEAFRQSQLTEITLPKGLELCGRCIARQTPVVFAGPHATFKIDPGNPLFLIDSNGILYQRVDESTQLCEALDTSIEQCDVLPSTDAILPSAFNGCTSLKRIGFPEGLEFIGDSAFQNCASLAKAPLPDSLILIGAEAFAQTKIAAVLIPANLMFIGPSALNIEPPKTDIPTLHSLEASQGNSTYFMDGNMLCLRKSGKRSAIVRCLNRGPVVSIPDGTLSIAPHALTHTPSIREVCMSRDIFSIHPDAFPLRLSTTIRLELESDVCGRSYALVTNPSCPMLVLAGLDGSIDVETLFGLKDSVARSNHDFEYVVNRLACPQYLSDKARNSFEILINKNIDKCLADFARRDNIDGIGHMADLGFLTPSNIEPLLEKAYEQNNTALIGHLLNIKQQRFGLTRVDFSL